MRGQLSRLDDVSRARRHQDWAFGHEQGRLGMVAAWSSSSFYAKGGHLSTS
jgi:hypothetical protein